MVNAPDAGAQVARRAAENRLQMTATDLTDAELALVAAVATREGWTDLGTPPERHPPRTLAEELAVDRFRTAVPRGKRPGRAGRLRARLAIAAISVAVLGACWWVSPTRTAIGLFGAGLFCLVALRRRNAPRRRATARAFGPRQA
jgi:Flp pilus assembly protein TadB